RNSALSVDLELQTGYKCSGCKSTHSERWPPMLRLTRWTMAHRRLVAIGWVAFAVGVLAISSSVGTRKANNFSLPNTGSQRATDLLTSRFPAQAGDADQIVFHARTGKLGDPAIRGAVTATIVRVSKLPHVAGVVSPYVSGSRAISP